MGVWIETSKREKAYKRQIVTPFVGVWIETLRMALNWKSYLVTPFVGVWIETPVGIEHIFRAAVTPFVGVWIETQRQPLLGLLMGKSHPSWVCGLKLLSLTISDLSNKSHPSWVCGLKQQYYKELNNNNSHTLRGCVD